MAGRPPIGERAMTATERVRRFRSKQRQGKPETKYETKPDAAVVAKLKARVRELEQELAAACAQIVEMDVERRKGQLTRKHREERGRPVEFTEVGKLRAEIAKLKSDIVKLKAALQEEPDAAKLRKKIIDQQVEMASLRQALKRAAKERDEYQSRTQQYSKLKHQEARGLLIRPNYNVLIKALHSD